MEFKTITPPTEGGSSYKPDADQQTTKSAPADSTCPTCGAKKKAGASGSTTTGSSAFGGGGAKGAVDAIGGIVSMIGSFI